MIKGMVQTYLAEFKMVEENAAVGYKSCFLLAITQDKKLGETFHLLCISGKHRKFTSIFGEDLLEFVLSYQVV